MELANRVSQPIKEIMGDSQQLAKTIEQTNAKIGVTKDVIKYRDKLDRLKAKQDAVGNSNKRLAPLIAEVERRYSNASRKAQRYGFAVNDITNENKKLERSLERLEQRQRRVAKAESARAKATEMRGKALAILGAGYAAVAGARSAANVERLETRLETVLISDNVSEDMQKARDHARNLAINSLATESEILEINYNLSSSNLGAEAARFGAEIAHKVGVITNGSSNEVGMIIGTAFNNFGNELTGSVDERVTRIGEILTKTQQTFKFDSFAPLQESFKQGASSAISYGVSLEQTAAILGQLNTAGLEGGKAGTTLGAVLRNLTEASDQLGFTVHQTSNGGLDMVATLIELQQVLQDDFGDDTISQANALQKAFGDEGRGISNLLEQIDGLKTGYAGIQSSKGIINKDYLKFLQDAQGQQERFAQNLKLISDSIFGALLPGINSVLSPLTSFFGWVAMGINKFPIIAQLIGIIASAFLGFFTIMASKTFLVWAYNAAMGGSGIAATLAATKIVAFNTVLLASKAAMGIATAATWLFNAAFVASPIGWVVLAITAVIAAIAGLVYGVTWLYNNWDTAFKYIKSGIAALLYPLGAVKKLWDSIFGSDGKAQKAVEVTETVKQQRQQVQGNSSVDNVVPIQPYMDAKYQQQQTLSSGLAKTPQSVATNNIINLHSPEPVVVERLESNTDSVERSEHVREITQIIRETQPLVQPAQSIANHNNVVNFHREDTPLIVKDTPPLKPNKTIQVTQDNSLHLGEVVFHAQPGMDEQQLMNLFNEYIKRNHEEIDRRARGRLSDGTLLNGYG